MCYNLTMVEAITDIPFELKPEELLKKAHVETGTDDAKEFESLVIEAQKVARPKALYKECFIQSKGEETITIDGITFTSRVLRRNLDRVERVFAYLATCGKEVDEINIPKGDFLKEFWLDTIKQTLLGVSTGYLNELLQRRYRPGKTSAIGPGTGDVSIWPIEQQKELFALFGNAEDLIGVRLTESFLMMPNKSVSGLRFPVEIDFHSCQLCRREVCPSRRAPFDRNLWDSVQHPAGK